MEPKTNFKALSTKAKLQYIWDYYKLPFIIIGAIAVVIGSVAMQISSYEPPLFNVIMFNCNHAVDTTAVGFYDFLDEEGIEHTDAAIALTSTLNFTENASTTMYDRQTLTTLLYAGGQDILMGTGDVYMAYVEQNVLMDLRDALSAETLQKYEDSLIYSTVEETGESYPCAVELNGNSWLKKYDYYDNCYFGIPYGAGNLELAKQFAEYLLAK